MNRPRPKAIRFRDGHGLWQGFIPPETLSQQERDDLTADVLRRTGYVPPKWWEWRRWTETRFTLEVLDALERKKAEKEGGE